MHVPAALGASSSYEGNPLQLSSQAVDEVSGVDLERGREAHQGSDRRVHFAPFDEGHVATVNPGKFAEALLRETALLTLTA